MKKRSSFVVLSTVVAMSLANIASPAFASTEQKAVVTAQAAGVQEQLEPEWSGHTSARDVNQYFCGKSFNGLTTTFRGRDQANFGNSGTNEGFNQDNNGNGGNQFIHTRGTNGPLRINQVNCGASNNNNTTLTVGENQANTGNSGINRGFNQDNGVNAGNQIIN